MHQRAVDVATKEKSRRSCVHGVSQDATTPVASSVAGLSKLQLSEPTTRAMESCWSPDTTPIGKLPPFEIAKAFAFDQVLAHLENHTGTPVRTLLGEDKGLFISKQLALQGGGNPSRSAVFKVLQKCRQPGWFPGKVSGRRTGRPPAFSHRQKAAMAKVAMATKRRLEKPTPQWCGQLYHALV